MMKKRIGGFIFNSKKNDDQSADEYTLTENGFQAILNEYIPGDDTDEGVTERMGTDADHEPTEYQPGEAIDYSNDSRDNEESDGEALTSEVNIAKNVAKQLHIAYLDLNDFDIDPQTTALVSAEHIHRYNLLPIGFEGGRLVTAMSGSTSIAAVHDLNLITGYYIEPVVVTESSLRAAIERYAPCEFTDDASEEAQAGGGPSAAKRALRTIIGSYITSDTNNEPQETPDKETTLNQQVDDTTDDDFQPDTTRFSARREAFEEILEDFNEKIGDEHEYKSNEASEIATDEHTVIEATQAIAEEDHQENRQQDEPDDIFEALGDTDNQEIPDSGCVSETDIAINVAKQLHIDYVDLSSYEINPQALSILSSEHIRRYNLLPIDFDEDRLIVAMSDPTNIFAIDDLHVMTGHNIVPVVVSESELRSAIYKYSTSDIAVEEAIENMGDAADHTGGYTQAEEDAAEEAPVVKLVNLIVTEAARERASDIFIEPQENDLRIRYRVDGVLQEIMRSPKHAQAGIISRIKIMAGLDIAERRIPQDGRFGLVIDKRPIDFRVATLPTIHGEQIVLRLLEKDNIMLNLDELGFLPESLEAFKESFSKPYGAILITGPTGSGKTTTLYAVLNILNIKEKNLITVEDPVEYRLPSINQVQVNTKTGLTFASALRSILRHDPDVIMIGEIRDEETATIAIESALTGHLVLSTLHTNNAPATLTRLIEMGIEPFLVSSAVDCIISQRLARKLCTRCREPYQPTREELIETGYKIDGSEPTELHRARGCKFCGGTGYQGRIGLYEVMKMSENIERLLVGRPTIEEITKAAISEGMRTLRQDGLEKVRAGLTSIEEIARVTM